jgi:hypothetical protein
MAVSLPVLVWAYEAFYHTAAKWSIVELLKRARTDLAPALASIMLTAVYISIKMWTAGSIVSAEGFRPVYTWARFFESNIHFLNEIFYRQDFTPSLVMTIWGAALLAALILRDRRLLFLFVWVVVTPLPIAFIANRGGACLYIPAAGWAMLIAVAGDSLVHRIALGAAWRKRVSQGVSVCLVGVLVFSYWKITTRYHGYRQDAYLQDGVKTSNLIEQIRALPAPPNRSRIIFLNDPFTGQDAEFISSLWWNDHSLRIWNQNWYHLPESEIARMDYIYDFPGGKLTRLKP